MAHCSLSHLPWLSPSTELFKAVEERAEECYRARYLRIMQDRKMLSYRQKIPGEL
jgi:hypothetical protein